MADNVYRVKDKWHPGINGKEEPWVYSNHKNFHNDVDEFFMWIAMHNNWVIAGVELYPHPFKDLDFE